MGDHTRRQRLDGFSTPYEDGYKACMLRDQSVKAEAANYTVTPTNMTMDRQYWIGAPEQSGHANGNDSHIDTEMDHEIFPMAAPQSLSTADRRN